MLDKKLQIRVGQTIAVVGHDGPLELAASRAGISQADALLMFARNEAELQQQLPELKRAADEEKLVWVAYPKAGQLGTDINRDSVRAIANGHGLDPVRQIAIDDTWSALRLKSL